MRFVADLDVDLELLICPECTSIEEPPKVCGDKCICGGVYEPLGRCVERWKEKLDIVWFAVNEARGLKEMGGNANRANHIVASTILKGGHFNP